MKPDFEQLVNKYINLVYYFARRWVKNQDEVNDIVHGTYLKAFKTYKTFQFNSEAQLKSWLLRICRNIILDSHKEKKLISFDEQIHDLEGNNNIEDWLNQEIKTEDQKKIMTEFQKLAPADKEIISLKVFEEMSFKELSEIFNTSVGSVKMKFYRVIEKLKQTI